ncbi:MAG TPA: DNRLRE domain-containing protein [Terriglobales bacterium]|nr:DNRLRE domain-containing protein [Terriglobales bacterium]
MRATTFAYVVVVSLVILVPSICFGQAAATDDSYVASSAGTTNYGTSPSLEVINPGVYTYIRPDLSRLPAGLTGTQVSKATLRLFVTAVSANGTFQACEVGGSAGSWSESTLTYNNRPATLTCSSSYSITSASKNQYVDIDITSFVQDWLNGTHPNNGVMLQPSSGSSIAVAFESKESTSTSHDAELNVVYDNSLGQLTGQIGPSQVAPGTYGINISGSAMTLAGPTSQCSSPLFATGIASSGNANCSQVQFSQLGGGISLSQLPPNIVFSNQASFITGSLAPSGGGTITATSAATATTAGTSTNFTGNLSGDVTGSQGTTVVVSIGGKPAANVVFTNQANTYAAGNKQTDLLP